MDLTPYSNYIWVCIIIGSIIIGGKVIFNSQYFKEKAKGKTYESRKKAGPVGMIAKAKDLIETAPQKLEQVNLEISELKKQGVTEDQMGHLLFEKQIIEMANSRLGNMFGETVIDIGQQLAKKVGLNLK